MSKLSKSLEKRIQELTASIESNQNELAAYERVLNIELSKGDTPDESVSADSEIELPVTGKKRGRKPKSATRKSYKTAAKGAARGNKTTMVAEIVEGLGKAGATPKEVDAYFTARDIPRSKNLIYNTLSYLVAHNRLVRRDGRYFVMGGAASPAKKRAGAKKSSSKNVPPKKKRQLSPEGLKRIKDALKKRWAAKKAADAESGSAAETKTATKKKQA